MSMQFIYFNNDLEKHYLLHVNTTFQLHKIYL